MKILDIPKQNRPRERFLKLGPEALSDSELFAILLRTGTRGKKERKTSVPYHQYAPDSGRDPETDFRWIPLLPRGTQIDFMTVDVEGFDHEVISSNDWDLYRPRVVLVELLNTDIQNLDMHPTSQILCQRNYRVIAKTFNTYFFVANEAFPPNE